jgi:hypothetical protein
VQPADIGRLVTVADPKVSPDGRRVAFLPRHGVRHEFVAAPNPI